MAARVGPVVESRGPWWHSRFHNKVGAAFSSSGAVNGGSEEAIHSILTMMMHLRMIVVTPGLTEPALVEGRSPYAVTAVTGPGGDRELSLVERDAARELGRRVAEVTSWVRAGRAARRLSRR